MKKTLLLAFAALCFVQSALAWGKSGHDAVAYIAETHLTKRAKAVIERYLGHSIVYDASWMDDYRAEPGYEMTNWWHVDYGKGEPTKDAAGNPLEPNVLRELNRAIERLRDYRNLDDTTVVVNLRYVIHLVGDMHCPSHVNYQQSRMRVLFYGVDTQYHALFDGGILDRKHRWGYMEYKHQLDRYSRRRQVGPVLLQQSDRFVGSPAHQGFVPAGQGAQRTVRLNNTLFNLLFSGSNTRPPPESACSAVFGGRYSSGRSRTDSEACLLNTSIRNIGWLPRFLEVVFGNAGANRYLWRVEIKQQQHKPMKATYLGLELDSPIVVSSSPYTATLANIEKCAAAGAGAVVLKSIFEEQILHHAASLEQYSDSPYGDAGDYLQRYLGEDYKAGFLQLIADARRATRIPVIASINCVAAGEEWIEYAAAMARAGASALELNIFIQPVDAARSSQELERLYVTIAQRVCAEVKIPVSVKLAMRFTNVVAMAAALESVGVKGAVLFNRFFEPDVDVERMTFVEGSPYSEASELRNVLRTTAICVGALPRMDFAVSTGVHDGEAAVKALLCGAAAVEVCTAIHREGFDVIARMNEWIDAWAARHGITALDEFKGRLGFGKSDSEFFQRVQYMKYFPGKD